MLRALAGMDCDTFLKPNPCPPVVEDAARQRGLRTFDMPHLKSWLGSQYEPHAEIYPYSLPTNRVEAAQRPLMVFQTSGTTGKPKPITVRLGSAFKLDTYHKLPELGQKPWLIAHLAGQRVLSTFGWYQFAGFLFHVICAVYFDYIIVTAPEVHEWSSESIEAAVLQGNIQSCFIYPGACVELCLDENRSRLRSLRRLKMIIYAGSSIPIWVGHKLSEYTQVAQLIGATEASIFPQEMPRTTEEWSYIRFQPQSGVEFRPYQDLEGCYELVIVRQKDLEDWQAVFVNFPELHEYPMGDLYQRHPTDPDLWLSVGRIVDLFTIPGPDRRVFTPVPIECDIAENPDLLLAMVCGLSPMDKLVILLTTRLPLAEVGHAEFIDRIWPSVQRSFHEKGPKWVEKLLDKNLVAITPRGGLPVQRTGWKWNVNRSKTLAMHRDRLEKLFGRLTMPSTWFGSFSH